jgi:hypothetical protein
MDKKLVKEFIVKYLKNNNQYHPKCLGNAEIVKKLYTHLENHPEHGNLIPEGMTFHYFCESINEGYRIAVHKDMQEQMKDIHKKFNSF